MITPLLKATFFYYQIAVRELERRNGTRCSNDQRRMLISLSMVICLLAIVLVIAAVMFSLIISRKDHAAKVSKPEAAVQGKRTLVTF